MRPQGAPRGAALSQAVCPHAAALRPLRQSNAVGHYMRHYMRLHAAVCGEYVTEHAAKTR